MDNEKRFLRGSPLNPEIGVCSVDIREIKKLLFLVHSVIHDRLSLSKRTMEETGIALKSMRDFP